ncbi:MAG TPA: hypothetical protein VGD58_18790 [Herpetosiphonaceae bacterium]
MNRFTLARLAIIPLLMLSILPMFSTPAVRAAEGERCFPETGHCISGRFREYWERNGGLAVFGFPIGPAIQERNRDTGQTYLTQWFQRNRFELHPENKPPYDVLLGRLGDDWLEQRGDDWRKEDRARQEPGCLYFEQTGRNVCDQASGLGFKSYWQSHGLEFDGQRGTSYAESLALFGLPLTEPRMENNSSGDRVLTQWFERARFEWHPNQSDPVFRVLLGLLGNELRGPYSAGADLPLDEPWVRTGNRVVGIADGLPTLTLPQNPAGGPPNVVVAPSGKRIAYTEASGANSSEQRLVVLNLDSGIRREIPLGRNGLVFGSVFSPDSERLAYSVVFSDALGRYEFRVLDLASGNSSVRLQGSAGPMPVVVTWNRGGLFVRKILYASDAPPQGLFLVDLQSNTLQTIYDGINYGAEPSPDGQKIALVTGDLPIGSPPRTMLSVLDRKTGRTTTIEAQAQQFVGNVSWSPDGSRLVYSRTLDNGARISTINVSAPDGTSKQALRLSAGSFPGEGQIQDLAWRNNQSLLLLIRESQQRSSVFTVALDRFDPANARQLQAFPREGEFFDEFVYLPR